MRNYKNESSLRSNSRSLSSNRKKSLSSTLSRMASASRPDEIKALTPCQVPRKVDSTSNVVNIANLTENKSKHEFLTILLSVTANKLFFSFLKITRWLTSDRITTLLITPTCKLHYLPF